MPPVIIPPVNKNPFNRYAVVPSCFDNLVFCMTPRTGTTDLVSGVDATYVRAGTKTGINSQFSPAIIPANLWTMYVNNPDCVYLEPSWTNAILWSNSFTAGHGYTLTNITGAVSSTEYVIADVAGNPLYATLLTASNATNSVSSTISVSTGVAITLSGFVKASSSSVVIGFGDGTNTFSATYDPVNDAFSGVVNAGSLVYTLSSKHVYGSTGWYRVWLTVTPKATSASGYLSFGSSTSTGSFYLSAIQKVTGDVPGSYVYTDASSTATTADVSNTSGGGLQIANAFGLNASFMGYKMGELV